MRRLFLHIGAHKAGTTALQESLSHGRAQLESLGLSYVTTPLLVHLHSFLEPQAPAAHVPQGFTVRDPAALATALSSAPLANVVASSENFSFLFQPEPIAGLERALRPHFDEIRILSYLRRQDRHAVSHHQEGARPRRRAEGDLWGHAPNALPDPSPAQDLYLDYDRRLGLWADVFGPDCLDLRVYDRKRLRQGDILADFLALIGLDQAGLATVGDKNISLGAAQTKVGHLMNGLGITALVADAVLERIGTEGRLLPSQDQARAFLDRYRASNRRLNARFRITDLPDLFDDDFDDFPADPHGDWTENTANAALRACLAQTQEVAPAPSGLTADDLRDAAIALQHKRPQTALRLITVAQALRPEGATIVRLKAELEAKLTATRPPP